MIDGFHLLRPDLLWALLACPLVALALWYRRVHQGDWTKVIDAELLPYLLPDQRGKAQRSRIWIPTLLLALVALDDEYVQLTDPGGFLAYVKDGVDATLRAPWAAEGRCRTEVPVAE